MLSYFELEYNGDFSNADGILVAPYCIELSFGDMPDLILKLFELVTFTYVLRLAT